MRFVQGSHALSPAETHVIDGRQVDVKLALPREDIRARTDAIVASAPVRPRRSPTLSDGFLSSPRSSLSLPLPAAHQQDLHRWPE